MPSCSDFLKLKLQICILVHYSCCNYSTSWNLKDFQSEENKNKRKLRHADSPNTCKAHHYYTKVFSTIQFLSDIVTDQVANGRPFHVVDQSRKDQNEGRRVGGSLLPCRLCKFLGRERGRKGGKEHRFHY